MVIFTQVGPGRAFTSSFAPLASGWTASERAKVERETWEKRIASSFLFCLVRSFPLSRQGGRPVHVAQLSRPRLPPALTVASADCDFQRERLYNNNKNVF